MVAGPTEGGMLLSIFSLVLTGATTAHGGAGHNASGQAAGTRPLLRQHLDCGVGDAERRSCGFPGIEEEACNSRGCCYQHSETPGAVACFHSKIPADLDCAPSPGNDDLCGAEGISGDACKEQGCCYGPVEPHGEPKCFRRRAVTLAVGLDAVEEPQPRSCRVPGPEKIDCGFQGITPDQCADKGCCYFHGVPGHPLCYYKEDRAPPEAVAAFEECHELDEERIDCGFKGVTKEQCEERGCCYRHPATPGAPFCYEKPHGPRTDKEEGTLQCVMPDADRVDCGFQGVTPGECRDKGCCYFHSHFGNTAPYCYFRADKVPAGLAMGPKECSIDNTKKVSCAAGPGDTPEQCVARGCCYERTPDAAAPSCFFNPKVVEQCNVPGPERKECGVPGISSTECIDEGCCYAHSDTAGAPTCFYNKEVSTTMIAPPLSSTANLRSSTVAPPKISPPTARPVPPSQVHPLSGSPQGDPQSGNHFASSGQEAVEGTTVKTLAVVLGGIALGLVLTAAWCFWTQPMQEREGEEHEPLNPAGPVTPRAKFKLLPYGSKPYKFYEEEFLKKWDTRTWPTSGGHFVAAPKIAAIYEIESEHQMLSYKAKQREIDSRWEREHSLGEQLRFHGARQKCGFGGDLCSDSKCAVCRIIESGNFAVNRMRGEIHFRAGSHAAKGQGLAPGKTPPPESLEDFVHSAAGNAVFLANVLIGNPQTITERTIGPPPAGIDSRVAETTYGVDETTIFDEAQAVPKALYLFNTCQEVTGHAGTPCS